MKIRTFILSALCLILTLLSCKKNNEATTAKISLTGRWNIASDTTFFTSYFINSQYVNSAPKVPSDTTIIKVLSTDYYDFNASGQLNISEKNSVGNETLNYKVANDSTVYINYLNSNSVQTNGVLYISALSAHKLVVTSALITPETVSLNIVHLSR